jgi:hypothetical protein
MSFWAWLVSLSTVVSSSIHIVTNDRISFYEWMHSIPLCTCAALPLSIHYLGCCNFLVHNEHERAAVSLTYWCHFLWLYVSSSSVSKSYGHSTFNFLGISIPFYIVTILTCISTNSVQGFPFPTSFLVLTIFCLSGDSHFNWGMVISHCGFDLHICNDWWLIISAFYTCSVGYLHVFFCKISI